MVGVEVGVEVVVVVGVEVGVGVEVVVVVGVGVEVVVVVGVGVEVVVEVVVELSGQGDTAHKSPNKFMETEIHKKPSKVLIHWSYQNQKGIYLDEPTSIFWDDYWNEWNDSQWTEGNNSCDCNRSRLFGLGEFSCNVGENKIELDEIEIIE